MLTLSILGIFFLLLVLGVALSIYFANRWNNPLMAMLAIMFIVMAIITASQIITIAAQLDNIRLG